MRSGKRKAPQSKNDREAEYGLFITNTSTNTPNCQVGCGPVGPGALAEDLLQLGNLTEILAGHDFEIAGNATVPLLTNELGKPAVFFINAAQRGQYFNETDRLILRLNATSGNQIGNITIGTCTVMLNPGDTLYAWNHITTAKGPYLQVSARTLTKA